MAAHASWLGPFDRDRITVTLEAQRSYTFDVFGRASGLGTLSDTVLQLFDPTGSTRLAWDDGSGLGREARLTFVPENTGTYVLEILTFGGGRGGPDSGTYELVMVTENTAEALPVYGTVGANAITLGGGHDLANGLAGDDTILGGFGNDTLFGRAGNDSLVGGAGFDEPNAADGYDAAEGGQRRAVRILGPGTGTESAT